MIMIDSTKLVVVAVLVSLLVAVGTVGAAHVRGDWNERDKDVAGTLLRQGVLAEEHELLTATIGVRQKNVDVLADVVEGVSDPKSVRYGQHWSVEQLSALLVDKEHVDRVLAWLASHHISDDNVSVRPSGDFVTARLTVGQASALFSVPFYRYHSGSSDTLVLSDRLPTLPQHVRDCVDVVLGVTATAATAGRAHRRMQVQPFGAKRAPSPSASNAPQIAGLLASDTTLYLHFVPLCKDGSPADGSLCANSGPAIEGFQLTQTAAGAKPVTAAISCDGATKQASNSKQQQQQGVLCAASTAALGAFQLVNVSMTTVYSDGSQSQSGSAGDAVYTTPFVDAALNSIFYAIPAASNAEPFSKWNQSVVEFSHNFFSFADLGAYLQYNKLEDGAGHVSVVGPNDGSNPEGEADQDIQWIMGTGQRVDTVFWSTANANAFILDWLEAVASTPDDAVPRVFSLSYGNPEGLSNKQFGANYIQRGEVEFMKLAARGISVTVADGDSGASSDLGCDKFWPDWPATSAYVTSCGGATISSYSLPNTAVAVGTRTGVAYTTGGGFSAVFPRPSYQDAAVTEYLTKHSSVLPPSSMFNSSCRAFPDVATLGYNLLTFYADQTWINPFPGGGTSFAAPIMAGMISRLNEARAAAGRPPMGLLNHWLYQTAAAAPASFYDITVGDNQCVMFGVPCCQYGFTAVSGYDPVSGLGSPRFDQLLQHVMDPWLSY